MKLSFAAIGLLLSGLLVPSCAETCNKPLKIVASLPLEADQNLRRLIVPVVIAGQPKKMVLDTGAESSLITHAAAEALGLKLRDAPIKLFDVTGYHTERMTQAPFKLGQIQFDNVQLMVSDNSDFGDADVVGLLGTNILSLFDISISMTGKKLDVLSNDHCPDSVVYWPADTLVKIPFDRVLGGQIMINAKLDGKPIKAVLDTGATNSTLSTKKAELQYGLRLGDADTPVNGPTNGDKSMESYRHTFKTLSFEGITVNNPNITLIPDRLSEPMAYTPTGSRVSHKDDSDTWDMLLGMNVLRRLHLFIAFHDRVLYLTPAEPAPQ